VAIAHMCRAQEARRHPTCDASAVRRIAAVRRRRHPSRQRCRNRCVLRPRRSARVRRTLRPFRRQPPSGRRRCATVPLSGWHRPYGGVMASCFDRCQSHGRAEAGTRSSNRCPGDWTEPAPIPPVVAVRRARPCSGGQCARDEAGTRTASAHVLAMHIHDAALKSLNA